MKMCIIKLGADGDVLRTLPLAEALKEKYNTEITWITRGDISTLLKGNPNIDIIKTLPYIDEEEFDMLYNFDVEKTATELAKAIKAEKRYGFSSDSGYPVAFNPGSEYYLNTMFDDELKKANNKTYQEMMFMAAELPYEKVRYKIYLSGDDKEYAQRFVDANLLQDDKIIGIHMGAGSRWPSKAWHKERVKEFIKLADKEGYAVILFGGPNEVEEHTSFAEELKKEGINVYRNNPKNSKREFASLVSICDFLVCSDSFAMHVSIGLGIETIALFFVTNPNEIEDYGIVKKVVSPMLKDFFPEKSDVYSEELTKSIKARDVFNFVKEDSVK